MAFSNSHDHSIIIFASDKQYLQRIYRKAGKSKILMIKTFSVLLYLLIKDQLKATNEIIIDREYVGYDKMIKDFLIEFCDKNDVKINRSAVHFRNIGKKSRAHCIAINAYRNKKSDTKITASDILKLVL